MSFRNNMKNTISKDFDKSKNLDNIYIKIEEKKSVIKNKKAINVIAMIASFIVIVFITTAVWQGGKTNNIHETLNDSYAININRIVEEYPETVDKDIVDIVTEVETAFQKNNMLQYMKELTEYPFYKELVIPDGFDTLSIYGVYEKNSIEDTKYDKLNSYVINTKSKTSEVVFKDIVITFSPNNEIKPLRDYYLSSTTNIKSIINDIELLIYNGKSSNYTESYLAMFEYNKMKFAVETRGITETEFIDLLKSIIK